MAAARGGSGASRRAGPQIISVQLPAPQGAADVERLPTLVRADGVPYRVPLRWVIRQRRTRAEGTIIANLGAIAELYAWLQRVFEADPDDLLEPGFMLPMDGDRTTSIRALSSYLSEIGAKNPRRGARLARQLHTMRDFLLWCADPLVRGGRTPVPAAEMEQYKEHLSARLDDFVEEFDLTSTRIEPLGADRDRALRELIEPRRDLGGRFLLPLRFSDQNPFRPETRLRNWLMYVAARDYGLRRGEVLTLRTSDLTGGSDGPVLRVVRRPNAADPRRRKPAVKRLSRDLPVPNAFLSAARAYLTTPLPTGRRGAHTELLFVTGVGTPLSWTSMHYVLKVAAKCLGWPRGTLSWHTLRHTWAEDLAAELLDEDTRRKAERNGHDPQAPVAFWPIEVLRELGGWSRSSNMPAYYIQNVLRAHGARYFRARQERLWDRGGFLASLHVNEDQLPI